MPPIGPCDSFRPLGPASALIILEDRVNAVQRADSHGDLRVGPTNKDNGPPTGISQCGFQGILVDPPDDEIIHLRSALLCVDECSDLEVL